MNEGDVCSSLKSTKDPSKIKADCDLREGYCYDRYKRYEVFNYLLTKRMNEIQKTMIIFQ